MSDSIQSQITDKVVTVLNTTSWPAYRTRMTDFAATQLPAFNVIPDKSDPEYLESDSIDRRFQFKVRHVAQSVDEVDKTVDALYVAGQKALFADTTLGNMVRVIREVGQKWELEKGVLDTVALVVEYEVEFCTSRTDPSVAGV